MSKSRVQTQDCEKVPVNNFEAAEQGLTCLGNVSGRYSNLSFHFSQ